MTSGLVAMRPLTYPNPRIPSSYHSRSHLLVSLAAMDSMLYMRLSIATVQSQALLSLDEGVVKPWLLKLSEAIWDCLD